MVDPHRFQSATLLLSLLLPLAGTTLLLFGGKLRRDNKDIPRWPGLFAVGLAVCTLVLSVIATVAAQTSGTLSIQGGEWIPGFGPAVCLYLDWLSSSLLLLLEIIGLMVLWFSLGYMKQEHDQRRYFGSLLFFIGMMKLLILAGSYLLLFAGWEGVGLASYLLIAYHFERPRAAEAATKAFIVNRIGDAGLILGIIALA